MGYYVAKAKGYYDEVGLDVDIISGGGDISETTAVYNGTVDFGVTWVSNLINANAGGMELAGSSSGISEIRSGAGIQELQLRRLTGWRGGDKGASPSSGIQWQAQSLAIVRLPRICTFLTTPGMWDFISK